MADIDFKDDRDERREDRRDDRRDRNGYRGNKRRRDGKFAFYLAGKLERLVSYAHRAYHTTRLRSSSEQSCTESLVSAQVLHRTILI